MLQTSLLVGVAVGSGAVGVVIGEALHGFADQVRRDKEDDDRRWAAIGQGKRKRK